MSWSQTTPNNEICFNNAYFVYQVAQARDLKRKKEEVLAEVREVHKGHPKDIQKNAIDLVEGVYGNPKIPIDDLVNSYYDWCIKQFLKKSQIEIRFDVN